MDFLCPMFDRRWLTRHFRSQFYIRARLPFRHRIIFITWLSGPDRPLILVNATSPIGYKLTNSAPKTRPCAWAAIGKQHSITQRIHFNPHTASRASLHISHRGSPRAKIWHRAALVNRSPRQLSGIGTSSIHHSAPIQFGNWPRQITRFGEHRIYLAIGPGKSLDSENTAATISAVPTAVDPWWNWGNSWER